MMLRVSGAIWSRASWRTTSKPSADCRRARDWRESFAVQSDYLSGNLTRMSEAASRYAELTSKMMQDLLTSGSRQMRKAARPTA